MNLNIEQHNQVTTVQLTGALDSVTAPEIQSLILPLAESGSKILLDMSNVTYMSSAGLRTLLVLYRKIHENVGKIVLVGLRDEIKDMMSVTGFLDYFETVDSHAAGIRALGQ